MNLVDLLTFSFEVPAAESEVPAYLSRTLGFIYYDFQVIATLILEESSLVEFGVADAETASAIIRKLRAAS